MRKPYEFTPEEPARPAVYIDAETALYLPGARRARIGNGVLEASRCMRRWGYDPRLSTTEEYSQAAEILRGLLPEFEGDLALQDTLTANSGIALISGRNEETNLPLVLIGGAADREYDHAAYHLENWHDPRLRGVLSLCADALHRTR